MFSINITSRKQTSRKGSKRFKDIRVSINKVLEMSKLEEIANGAVAAMRSKINKGIKRTGSTGLLADSLDINKEVDNKNKIVSFKIGRISDLPKYWYVINYGYQFNTKRPYIPPAYAGRFDGWPYKPIKCGAGQRWRGLRAGIWGAEKSFIRPKKAIEGIHYIEAGEKYIKKRLSQFK